jgi:hypothetical protein
LSEKSAVSSPEKSADQKIRIAMEKRRRVRAGSVISRCGGGRATVPSPED